MSWSWSHTADAHVNARAQLSVLNRETRNIIAAEWLAAIPHPRLGVGFSAELDTRKYPKSLIRVAAWTDGRINEFIWDRMEKLETCTNGGHEAHCCPFGCIPHMVPFDPVGVELRTAKGTEECAVCKQSFWEGHKVHSRKIKGQKREFFCTAHIPQPETEDEL